VVFFSFRLWLLGHWVAAQKRFVSVMFNNSLTFVPLSDNLFEKSVRKCQRQMSATNVSNSLFGLVWFGLANLLRCGWVFCPSHFAPTVNWGLPGNAELNEH